MSRSVAVIAVLAVAVLTACGSKDSGESTTNAAATNSATTAVAAATTSKGSTDPKTVLARCHKLFDPILVQLHGIDHIVDGTRSFGAYSAATSKLQATYHKFDDTTLSEGCSNAVGGPATRAYFRQFSATTLWTECRKRDDCAKVMPQIKAQWSEASKLIDTASKGFDDVTAN